jgi:O-antigen/teichoic acid export membrane protein
MNKIFEKIKKKKKLKIFIGISLVTIGLLVHLIPLVPGALIVVIGLEVLGVRSLVQNKLKKYFKNSKFFQKKLTKHDKK